MRKILLIIIFALLLQVCASAAGEPSDVLSALLTPQSNENAGSAASWLGCAAADALKAASGADIAIVNSGDLCSGATADAESRSGIQRVFREDLTLATAVVTAAQLTAVLEHALSYITVDPQTEQIDRQASDFPGFAQISGMRIKYDASARAGERVYAIIMPDGEVLDPEDTQTRLTLAATEYMLSGGYGYPAQTGLTPLDISITDAFASWLSKSEMPSDINRIIPLGTADSTLISYLPMTLLLLLLAAAVVLFPMLRLKHKNFCFLTRPMKPGSAKRYLRQL